MQLCSNRSGTNVLIMSVQSFILSAEVTFPAPELLEFVETLDQLFSSCMKLNRSGIYIGYGIFVDPDVFLHHLDKSVGDTDILDLISIFSLRW